MISRILLERALALFSIASQDANRPQIQGVYIVSHADEVTLTATNGHMLVTQKNEGLAWPEGKYFIDKACAKGLKTVLKETNKNLENIDCILDEKMRLFVGSLIGIRVFIEKYMLEYPDYKQVIPTIQEPVAVSFNARYLLALAEVLADGNKHSLRNAHVRIVFDPSQTTNPIRVELDGMEDTTCVLMPCRLNGTKKYEEAYKERVHQIHIKNDPLTKALEQDAINELKIKPKRKKV